MSFIPEEILSSFNFFKLSDSRRFYAAQSLHKPSARKRIKAVFPRKRRDGIKVEQQLAAKERTHKEINRPKIIYEEYGVSQAKPPAFYIEKARIQYLSKQHHRAYTDRSKASLRISPLESSKNRNLSEFTGSSKQLRTLDTSVYPDWLITQQDFKPNDSIMTSTQSIEVDTVVATSLRNRTEEGRELLSKWVISVPYFHKLPRLFISQVCDKLTYKEFSAHDTMIVKGAEADCMYLLYTGSASVFTGNDKVGQCFARDTIGEMALDSSTTRNATVIADQDCKTFIFSKTDYENIVFNIKKLEKHENSKFLMTVPYLKNWPFAKIQRLSTFLLMKYFKPGETLYEVGEESNTFYILKKGKVLIQAYAEVERRNKWPTGFKEWQIRQITRKYIVTLATLTPGEFFGESDLIGECPRQTRAVAETYSTCLVLNKNEFFEKFSVKDTAQMVSLIVPKKSELVKLILNSIEKRNKNVSFT